ncbi:glycosyltransferase [Parabacteroides pacaensis]|uniref:glycosyltransferase n=1 Tax=Parabacteroides pacaensis TaxID=2086575 RepID=UPI000D0EBB3E|nr:glycosyltransferase [Parabacteroides pacaensis]
MKEILCITTYPPRECGIATYSDDLIKALNNKFKDFFLIKVCALESETEKHTYPNRVKYKLNTSNSEDYKIITEKINNDKTIELVLIQHEFGFYANGHEDDFLQMLKNIHKPIIGVFHTVLPEPNNNLKKNVQDIAAYCGGIIVMTHKSANLLHTIYGVPEEKIHVIPHGTHLVPHLDKEELKEKYGVAGRTVLSTFGLLSAGKSIETTLDALPAIIKTDPSVIFLILGKTHPTVVKNEGESYRNMLEKKVETLHLEKHVRFVNSYLELSTLLEYLQLTDIYLFTSRDPNQAVSGTFVYALSCGCACVSTPIPHALEVLSDNSGVIVEFRNPEKLAEAVNKLITDKKFRDHVRINGLQKMVATAWENSAISHARVFQHVAGNTDPLHYTIPPVNLRHIKRLTRNFGMVQFSVINSPDLTSGYTLDDNARAMIAMCLLHHQTKENVCKNYIPTYLKFIEHCQLEDGSFMNYVDEKQNFTPQNQEVNLDDSNGRALWALGYFTSHSHGLPEEWAKQATRLFRQAQNHIQELQSPRALAFAIKGLYFYHKVHKSPENLSLIQDFADRLVNLYNQVAHPGWEWFEKYLTYANSVLPEALLCAYWATHITRYRTVAETSFEFLLRKIFPNEHIKVISNKTWLKENEESYEYGEQPIDVAYTVIACAKFFHEFHKKDYHDKQMLAFNWFLGANHLHQIIYNPSTGGCYDGLEKENVNLNQGAESAVSYLMARLIMEE